MGIAALFLIIPFGFSNFGYGMIGMMYGIYGYGMMSLSWIYGLLTLFALALLIAWLIKQIQKK